MKTVLRVSSADGSITAGAVWQYRGGIWFLTRVAPCLSFLWQWQYRPDRAKEALLARNLTWEWLR